MSNTLYDKLKWICLIAVPAVSTCFVTISSLLGMSAETITIVSGIIAALNTMLGTLLGISSSKYYKEKL